MGKVNDNTMNMDNSKYITPSFRLFDKYHYAYCTKETLEKLK